ncbi:MAG: hypothetical protein QGI33_04690 [Candidatus Brocadiia bacterium]|jgi:acyl dehydratase|nr:hypothetical protein [Candidatus Brocadiia bacterium]
MAYDFDDIDLGDEIGPWETAIPDDDVAEFCVLWGQGPGPTQFTSDDVAKGNGLPGALIPGIMQMGLMARLITDWSGGVDLTNLDIIFRQPLMHNRAIKLRGIVTDKREEGGVGVVEADVFLETEEGGTHSTGKAVFVLPTRG